jgi:hypothetical protein
MRIFVKLQISHLDSGKKLRFDTELHFLYHLEYL